MYDEVSVPFENPATDPMGYHHVEGRLHCGRDGVQLQFKPRDRAFRRNETRIVDFAFSEVESVACISGWFRAKRLVFSTRAPRKLDDFPGASVGRVELHIAGSHLEDARRLVDLIRFRQSEAWLEESERRLSSERGES